MEHHGEALLRKLLDEEVKIVDRVWAAVGVTNYKEAAGRTVWELVAALKVKADKYDARVAEDRSAPLRRNQ